MSGDRDSPVKPQTKKLLVPFDPADPERRSTGFLVPYLLNGQRVLRNLQSGEQHQLGMVVFIGVGITENDLFARLVDSGARIESVKPTLQLLAEYIEQLQRFTIGNVVRMRPATSPTESLSLELVSKYPRGNV